MTLSTSDRCSSPRLHPYRSGPIVVPPALGHLTSEPAEIDEFRTTSRFTYPAAATSGTVSVDTESDGTARVELEARG